MERRKQIEIEERIEVDDTRALAILDKLIKQRKDDASLRRTDILQLMLDAEQSQGEDDDHPWDYR